MIWATVSSQSCFCWLYRAFPSFAAKTIINPISVLTIWWCPCVESSLVLLENGVCYYQCVFLVTQRLQCLPPMRETQVRSLGQEDPLEKEMVTHISILAWKIPWITEPCRLPSMGSQRIRTRLSYFTFTLGRSPGGGHGNPLQYCCLENPHGQRSLAGYSPWCHQESDKIEQLSTHPN